MFFEKNFIWKIISFKTAWHSKTIAIWKNINRIIMSFKKFHWKANFLYHAKNNVLKKKIILEFALAMLHLYAILDLIVENEYFWSTISFLLAHIQFSTSYDYALIQSAILNKGRHSRCISSHAMTMINTSINTTQNF